MNKYLEQVKKSYEIQDIYQKNNGSIKISSRSNYLRQLQQLLVTNKNIFEDTVYTDIGKSKIEFSLSEFTPLIHEIKFAQKNILRWTKLKRVKKRLLYLTSSGYIRYEPKGVVLIISPWNLPLLLSLGPVISALAAGNSVILKPSELSPATSRALADILNNNFDPEILRVETGDAQTVIELQKLPFNHIFFTGSPAIGKKVMESASKHLASVTLELGGKSPAIIDRGTDMVDAAEKIAFGKFMNCGQNCISPDYIFVHQDERDKFLKFFTDAIKKMYYHNSDSLQNNSDYGRIINIHHFKRVQKLFDEVVNTGANIAFGGKSDPDKLFFEPTVITDPGLETALMNEEIFGPLLPVLSYENESEVIDFILSKPRPLTLYIFSKNRKSIRHYLDRIISGSAVINEVFIQFSHPGLPFGGINNSGIGSSHGYYGFKTFSHERAILYQSRWLSLIRLLSPPYGRTKKTILNFAEKYMG